MSRASSVTHISQSLRESVWWRIRGIAGLFTALFWIVVFLLLDTPVRNRRLRRAALRTVPRPVGAAARSDPDFPDSTDPRAARL